MSVLGAKQKEYFDTVATSNKVWIQVCDRVEDENEMKGKLSSAVDQLEKWVLEGKNVLVHCQSGISRSATVVIATNKKTPDPFDSGVQFGNREKKSNKLK